MRPWLLAPPIVMVVALALIVGTCGGGNDGDDNATTSPPASQAPPGGGDATPPASPDLPPEFVKCMADRGYDVKASADIHSAPPEVLQACFGAFHQGGR